MSKDSPDAFFARRDPSGALLGQKNHWLDTIPEHFLVTTATSERFAAELWQLAKAWGHLPEGEEETLESLAREWEADLIFLDADSFTVAGGCVCFPSSWSLAERTGETLAAVHGVVPQLHEAIGDKIELFLKKLTPGKAFHRANWGMTRSDELNYHPVLERRKLDATVSWDELFLRIEHQAFLRVELGIVLAVRIEPVALETLRVNHPEVLVNLRRQLATMPDTVAEYKCLDAAIPRILELIDSRSDR